MHRQQGQLFDLGKNLFGGICIRRTKPIQFDLQRGTKLLIHSFILGQPFGCRGADNTVRHFSSVHSGKTFRKLPLRSSGRKRVQRSQSSSTAKSTAFTPQKSIGMPLGRALRVYVSLMNLET